MKKVCTECGAVVSFGKNRKVKDPFICNLCLEQLSTPKQGEVKSITKKKNYFKGSKIEGTKKDNFELPEVQESDSPSDSGF